MATFKLNIARIRGCTPPNELNKAMKEFGLPDDEAFGVLNHSATDSTVFATIARRTQTAVQKLDTDSGEVLTAPVEKVTVYPFAVKPSAEVLEIYAGSVSAIEQIGLFFSSALGVPAVVEAIDLDIPSAIEKLAKETGKFQLKSVRVNDYAHNSYMSGPYVPKFLDTVHGLEFMEEYAELITAASVRFQGPSGRVNVRLTPKACFSFSCNEDDQPTVQTVLRKLV